MMKLFLWPGDFVAGLAELRDDGVLHFNSAMIGADSDAEIGFAHMLWDGPALNAGKARLQTGNFGKFTPIRYAGTTAV